MRAIRILVGILSMGCALASQAADPVVGTASIVVGSVSSTAPNGMSRPLNKGDAIYSGDRVSTEAAAYVRLSFVDGSTMVLRPGTEFAVETFRFSAAPPPVQVIAQPQDQSAAPLQVGGQTAETNQAFFRLVRGGFRAVSGLIGKVNRQEYAVRTPVATIGIRGTAYLSVVCDEDCAKDSVVQSSLPAGETALGGTVSAVDQGGVVITSISGKVASLGPAQFVLTTASGVQVTLTALPGFLLSESWLAAAEQAAAAVPEALEATAVSPVSVGATLGTLIVTSAIAVASESGGDGSTTTATTGPTGTAR